MTTTSTTVSTGQTARILVFPVRERTIAKASPEQRFAAMEAAARRHPIAAAGESWYHDDAISEDAISKDASRAT